MIGLILAIIGIYLHQRKDDRKSYVSLIILFFFITNGFQIIPISVLAFGINAISKTSDFALFYIFGCILSSPLKSVNVFFNIPYFNSVRWIIFVSFICAIYSYLIFDYEWTYINRVWRLYLFFLVFIPLASVKFEVLIRVIRTIVLITTGLSIVFLLQILIGKNILLSLGEVTNTTLQGTTYIRYYNTPILTIFSFCFLLFDTRFPHYKLRIVCLLILVITLFAPAHKSLIITVIFWVLFLYLYEKRFNKKIALILLLIPFLAFILSLTLVKSQISNSLQDFKHLSTISYGYGGDGTDTFFFRISHFYERFNYIYKDYSKWFFGIGFLTEDAPQTKHLNFNTGIIYQGQDKINQIDSGDISWSVIVLNGGFIFIILNFVIIMKFLILTFKNRILSFGKITFLYIAIYATLSFTSASIITYEFKISLMLLMILFLKEKYERKYKGINNNAFI